jgi:hypothetical protein
MDLTNLLSLQEQLGKELSVFATQDLMDKMNAISVPPGSPDRLKAEMEALMDVRVRFAVNLARRMIEESNAVLLAEIRKCCGSVPEEGTEKTAE